MRYELEMAFYLGQFVLYQPFLHYLIQMANGLPIIRIQSQHALACIKIASTTISRSEIMHQRGLLAPASWSVIYTLFQAVMCLLFLIATHNGTSRPSEAWKKGELGIRLLATMRCFDNGAVRCIWIIKVSLKLSFPSHFYPLFVQTTTTTTTTTPTTNDAHFHLYIRWS